MLDLPIPIPYKATYTTTMEGQLPKLVKCEQCRLEYVYLYQATASGRGTAFLFLDPEGAEERSRQRAEAFLMETLNSGIAVVPCPRCGWIQNRMVPLARKEHEQWMTKWAKVAAIVAGVLVVPTSVVTAISNEFGNRAAFIVALLAWTIIVTSAAGAIALLVRKHRASANYDPNSEAAETRIARGRIYAMTKEQFLAIPPEPPEEENRSMTTKLSF